MNCRAFLCLALAGAAVGLWGCATPQMYHGGERALGPAEAKAVHDWLSFPPRFEEGSNAVVGGAYREHALLLEELPTLASSPELAREPAAVFRVIQTAGGPVHSSTGQFLLAAGRAAYVAQLSEREPRATAVIEAISRTGPQRDRIRVRICIFEWAGDGWHHDRSMTWAEE